MKNHALHLGIKIPAYAGDYSPIYFKAFATAKVQLFFKVPKK